MSERQPRAQAGLISKVHLQHEITLLRLGEVIVLSKQKKSMKGVKEMKNQRNMFQTKEQDKISEIDFKEWR